MFTRFDNRIYLLLIFAISAFGFYLRIRGISWGIPLESNLLMSYHYDEGTYLMGIGNIQPSRLDFNVHIFHWGTVQFYFVWMGLKIAQLFGYVDASWTKLFRQFDMQEATRVFVTGRMVSVIFGTLTIPLVFIIGKELRGAGAGLLASLFIAFLPLHVVNAHYLTADITMCFFLLLTFFVSLLTFKSSHRSLYVMQGFLCGFTIATKYNASFMVLAIIASHFLQRETNWKKKGIAYLFIPVGFFVGEPYALLSFNEFYLQAKRFLFGQGNLGLAILNLPLHLKYMFCNTMGIFSFGVSFAGVFFLLKRRLKLDIFLLSALAAFSASVIFSNYTMVRYTVPLLAFLTLSSALFIDQLKGKRAKFFLITLVVISELCISVANVNVMVSEHPANKAAKWINDTIDKGRSIGRDSPVIPHIRHTKYKTSIVGWSVDSSGAHMEGLKGYPDFIVRTYAFNKIIEPQIRKHYQLLAKFENIPRIFGIPLEGENVAHDWEYSHPTIEVYAVVPLDYSVLPGDIIRFHDDESQSRHLVKGWSFTEKWGTWSEGKESLMVVNFTESKDYTMLIKATSFSVPGKQQNVRIYLDDNLLGEYTFTQPTTHFEDFEIKIPSVYIKEGTQQIRFVYSFTGSPAEYGMGPDIRQLAMGVSSIVFK